MLYLLRSYIKGGTILKVGYAKDLSYRFNQYQSHNPGIELLDSREGDLMFEQELHMYFHILGYEYGKDEWYRDVPDLIDKFKSISQEEVEKIVWEKRDKFYTSDYFNQYKLGLKRENESVLVQIYKKLLEINKDTLIPVDSPEHKANGCKFDELYFRYNDKERTESIDLSTVKEEIRNFITSFNSLTTFIDKMKLFCTTKFSTAEDEQIALDQIPVEYKNYINQLGKSKIIALGCQKSRLSGQIKKDTSPVVNISEDVYNVFKLGEKYTCLEIKKSLAILYSSLSYNKSPKATDLEEYFELKDCQVIVDGKKTRGYLILSKKKN